MPSAGVPLLRLGEEGWIRGADAGGSEKSVAGRNNVFAARDGHRLLDGTEDGVDRRMEAKGLLNDGLVQGQFGEVLVHEFREISPEDVDLLLVERLHDFRVLCEAEHDPGAGGGGRVLTSHEKSNHHVRNLVVGNLDSVLVGGVHEVLHHIILAIILVSGTTLLDCVHVNLGDCLLSNVAATVPGQGGPVKHEVDRREAHVEIVVKRGERLVELVANGRSLESMRGGEDGDLGHVLGDVANVGLALEVRVLLEVALNLARDDGDIGLESLGSEGDLHELFAEVVSQGFKNAPR